MRAVITRVLHAEVRVRGQQVGGIDSGLLVLVGVAASDTHQQARALAAKVHGLRILRGECSIAEPPPGPRPAVLVVSQFTLYGDARKGRRPTWSAAAPGDRARPLVEELVAELRRHGTSVETGAFGEDMQVESVNDGPMTILLEF